MLKNHLRLAWRGLLKRKGYSALNILGLAIGITCCLLIFHYVAYERSYDPFRPMPAASSASAWMHTSRENWPGNPPLPFPPSAPP
jgi:hypothetical protein